MNFRFRFFFLHPCHENHAEDVIKNALRGIDELSYSLVNRQREKKVPWCCFSQHQFSKGIATHWYMNFFFPTETFFFSSFSSNICVRREKKFFSTENHFGWYGDIRVLNCANKTYSESSRPIIITSQPFCVYVVCARERERALCV